MYENVDVLYSLIPGSSLGAFICLKNDGYYYAYGYNGRGLLGIDNNQQNVSEFTRIYPKGA